MRKKHFILFLCLLCTASVFISCEEEDTYAERRDRERSQIKTFLEKGIQAGNTESDKIALEVPPGIKVISEAAFYANDSTTDVANNEYVLFKGSGVYMQIVRKGTGRTLEPGETATILTRYVEYNIAVDSVQSTNRALAYETYPDVMTCRNSYGVLTASFTSGLMMSLYNSASVPSGWLIPLRFIRLGRQSEENGEIALVRLIVPSTEGQSDALTNVYPCFYEISYQRGR